MRLRLAECLLLDGPKAGERHLSCHQPGSRPRQFWWGKFGADATDADATDAEDAGPWMYRLVKVVGDDGYELHYSYRGEGTLENLLDRGLVEAVEEPDPADAWKREDATAAVVDVTVRQCRYSLAGGPANGSKVMVRREAGQALAAPFLVVSTANGTFGYVRAANGPPNHIVGLEDSRALSDGPPEEPTFIYHCVGPCPAGLGLPAAAK